MNVVYRFGVLFCLMFTISSSYALEKETFTQEKFEKLQAAGAVVLVDVYAPWCSTCKKQQAALEAYRTQNPDKKFHILEVDFDKQKPIVRQFRAPRQSTLLLYKGDKQFWFSVAESRPKVIAAEIDKAISFKAKKRS